MSRRPATPAAMLPLDFGPSVEASASYVPVSQAVDRMARPAVSEADQRLMAMWLHGKSIHTQRAYRRAAERFLEVVGKPLRSVTLGDLQSFSETLTGKASSRAQVIASVKALLSFGWRLGMLPVNVGPALSEIKAPDMLADRILSEAEIASMLACSKGRDHLLVRLLYAGGLRVSEVLGVRWSDVCRLAGRGRCLRATYATVHRREWVAFALVRRSFYSLEGRYPGVILRFPELAGSNSRAFILSWQAIGYKHVLTIGRTGRSAVRRPALVAHRGATSQPAGSTPTSPIVIPCRTNRLQHQLLISSLKSSGSWPMPLGDKRPMSTTSRLRDLGRLIVAVLDDTSAQGLLEYTLVIAFVVLIGLVGLRIFAAHAANVLNNDAIALPY